VGGVRAGGGGGGRGAGGGGAAGRRAGGLPLVGGAAGGGGGGADGGGRFGGDMARIVNPSFTEASATDTPLAPIEMDNPLYVPLAS
ncbi:Protein of unknown function, partial [Gryllus bimaculatus]